LNIYKFDPEDAIRFVKEQHLGIHRNNGRELITKECPYCRGTTRDRNTFAINLETGQFNCKRATCGVKGNMIRLAKDFGFSLGRDADEYYRPERAYRSLRRYPVPETKAGAVAYLVGRGISPDVTERYHITTYKDDETIIVFPFFDEGGEMQFIKYRNTAPKEGQSKEWCLSNCKPILFGMEQCDPEVKTLVLTEGQIDSLSCTQAGIKNAVSVPTGAKGFTWVPYCWDFLEKYNTLIVFGDHEHGHITLLDEMTQRFHGTVKHVHPDDYLGCKDANELLIKHGPGAVQNAVENAVPVENPKVKALASVRRENLADMERIGTGIGQLDQMTGGFFMKNLVILTGERGKGKSTLASQFGIFAIKAGYKTFFYSGELPDTQFRDWFDRQVAGNRNIAKGQTENGYQYYYAMDKSLERMEQWYKDKAFLYSNDELRRKGDAEDEALLDTIKCAIVQYQCRVLIIDNLMTAMTDDLQSDLYRQQSVFVSELVRMAAMYNVLIILVVHPRKKSFGKDTLDNDDVAGSANITNLAHLVLHYTSPKDDGCDRILRVLKNRNNGRVDYDGIPLWFQQSSKRISELNGVFDWTLGWEPEVSGLITEDGDYDTEIPF